MIAQGIAYQFSPTLDIKSIQIRPSQALYENIVIEVDNSKSDIIPRAEFLFIIDDQKEFHFGVNMAGIASFAVYQRYPTRRKGEVLSYPIDCDMAGILAGMDLVKVIIVPREGWRLSVPMLTTRLQAILSSHGVELTYKHYPGVGIWEPTVGHITNCEVNHFDERVGLVDSFGVTIIPKSLSDGTYVKCN